MAKRQLPFEVRESAPAYGAQMTERGRLVLPVALRRRLGLKSGERLTLTIDADGSLRMSRRIDLIRQLKGSWGPSTPGRSPVDDLLAERRREARRDDDE